MTDAERAARAQVIIGAIAIAAGAVGLVLARNLDFTAPVGAQIGWRDFELQFMRYNALGALVTIGVGLLAVLAGLLRRPLLAGVAAGASALMVVQVLVQWRTSGDNILGGSGRNLGFNLFLLGGLAVTFVLSRSSARIDAAQHRTIHTS